MSIKTNGSPLGEEVKLDYSSISTQLSFLLGKVLTVVDASIQDEFQRKAVKDLVKSAFNSQQSWIGELCYPKQKISTREQVASQGIDVDAVERGAVNYQE